MKRLLLILLLLPFLGFSQVSYQYLKGETEKKVKDYEAVVRDNGGKFYSEYSYRNINAFYMQSIGSEMMDSVKFMWIAEAASSKEENRYAEIHDMSGLDNNGTQTTELEQPYVVYDWVQNGKEGAKNPTGDTRTINITPITVSGTYTITKVCNNDSIGKTIVTHTEVTSGTLSSIEWYGTLYAYIIRSESLTATQKEEETNLLQSIYLEIPSVIINDQEWSNFNFEGIGTPQGTIINEVTDNVIWVSSQSIYDDSITAGYSVYESTKFAAMWCYYNNDSEIGATYGKLYNWFAVSLLQQDIDLYNAANPTNHWGWHVPSSTEFTTLQDNLGGSTIAGGKMKVEGFDYWNSPNTGASNSSGISALGGGLRNAVGAFSFIKDFSLFLTITSVGDLPYRVGIGYDSQESVVISGTFNKNAGLSLRLIKD